MLKVLRLLEYHRRRRHRCCCGPSPQTPVTQVLAGLQLHAPVYHKSNKDVKSEILYKCQYKISI